MRNVFLESNGSGAAARRRPWWSTALGMWLIMATCLRAETLTNLQAVRALAPQAGDDHQPFKLRAVVTYSDPEWHVLFIQDGDAGAFVSHGGSVEDPKFELTQGMWVELEGVTAAGLAHCNLADKHVRVLGQAALPAPLEISTAAELNDNAEGRRVRATGWVVSEQPLGNRVAVGILLIPGRVVTLVLKQMDGDFAESLRGNLIEATGVLGVKVDALGQRTADYLLLDDTTNSVRRLKELPVRTLDQLANLPMAEPFLEPLRLRGWLAQRPADREYELQDAARTKAVRIANPRLAGVAMDAEVEAIGFALRNGGEWVLTNAFLRAIGRERAGIPPPPAATNNTLPELDQILQVRRLSSEQADHKYPVRVTGVLTFFDPSGFKQFLQDESAGIYLNLDQLANDAPALAAGQRVEVSGFSGAGDYAPVIHAEQVRVLDQEWAFPRAVRTSGQLLLAGNEDSQWVSLQGVIRRQFPGTRGATVLVMSTGDSLLNLFVAGGRGTTAPADFVDSVVEVHGVCRTRFSANRQLTSVELDIPGWAQILTIEAAPKDPFAVPRHAIDELFQFHPSPSALHRTQVRGQVLLRLADGSFFLQDGTGGIRVQRSEAGTVSNGLSVAVVGFPGFVEGLPVLQDATVKVLEPERPLVPRRLTPESALNREFQGTLVEVEGNLIGRARRAHAQLLTIDFGQQPVEAVCEDSPAGSTLDDMVPGSRVQIRGVYVAQLDENRELAAFQILFPSRRDVVVLSRPSWWTSRHTSWVLGSLGAVLILSIGWIRLLRHQVRRRTQELRLEIAERQRGEATLRESEARFSTIFHSSPMAISLSEVDTGRFLDVNERFLRLFGFHREELSGATTTESQLWLLKGDRERLVGRLQAGGRGEQLETKFRWKSGEIGHALVSGSVVRVRDQRCLLCMIADITEHKKLEDQLRQSQKMEGIGQLAGGMAHEFNNILAAALMSLELAETSPAPEANLLLQEVKGLCTKAAQMIKQLLAFSRKSVVQLHPLELGAAFLRQRQMLQALMGERIALEYCVPFSRQLVNADSVLMEQVLLNLCLNARDAMADGGSLKIRVDDVEFAPGNLPAGAKARLGRFVCLAVSDTGCGMDERTLERLFEPFFTTKGVGHGTGLGLATVRGIVEQHQGWVDVESALGRGATFKVYLPALADARVAVAEAGPPPAPVRGSGTILLVEDDAAVRSLTRKLLLRHGYEVKAAVDGEEALALWRRHQQEIDLVLTDMVMPGSISGLDLANRTLADKPGLRVIISSGYNTDILDPRKHLHDSIIYVPKPVPPGTLTRLIHDCLHPA